MNPSLVHELNRIQAREGWLSEESLRELSGRLNVPLHRLESVSTFYTHYRRAPHEGLRLEVCRDLSCHMAGGAQALAALRERLGERRVEIHEVSCLGRCERAPAACLGHRVLETRSPEAVVAAIDEGDQEPETAPAGRWEAEIYPAPEDRYGTLRDWLGRDAAEMPGRLKESGLRGMGGAGFPTGLKWELVARESSAPKYVICNADESEPGTFKDRVVLSDLPHLVIEGMALAARAIGSTKGWVFIRHEYEAERRALQGAIDDAYARGALGQNIFGSDLSFDLEIFVSPGGYILGEETALLECMEDRRGEPRNKPPFPGQKGLWGQPTLINNVETFAHATGILHHGVEWWKGLGRGDHAGHKFISVSGDVQNPSVQLVPMGTTLGELLERCGGMKEGERLAAVAPGGASSNFLPPSCLSVPLDFDTLAEAGSMLGSGAAVFVSDRHDLLEVGLSITRFFRNESCGKCVPCRVGSEKAVDLIERAGALSSENQALLEELQTTMLQTSICGLGQVALAPLLSIARNFPDSIRRK